MTGLKQNFCTRLSPGGLVDLGMAEQDAIVLDAVSIHQKVLDGHGAGLGQRFQLLRRELGWG